MRRCRWLLKLPKQYQHLPAASYGRKKLANLTSEEKTELVSGKWRQAPEVEAELDPRANPDVQKVDEAKMKFASAEKFEEFSEEMMSTPPELQQYRDRAVQPSTLEIAATYHTELQSIVSQELDVMEPGNQTKTDIERAEENVEINHQYMIDFYVRQGLVSIGDRLPFIRWLTSPPVAFYQVSPCLPVRRPTVQAQLMNRPTTFVPLDFRDGVVSTAPSMGLTFDVNQLPDEEVSRAPLRDAHDHEDDTLAVVGESRGPSIDELMWLQRNVATGALLPMDLHGLVLPLVVDMLTTDVASPTVLDWNSSESDCDGASADIQSYCRWLQLTMSDKQLPTVCVRQRFKDGTPVIGENVINFYCSDEERPLFDVVLCAPLTTKDGQRVPPVEFTGEQIHKPRANNFAVMLSEINSFHEKQLSNLSNAMRSVKPGGFVVYCTKSMNPLENEAVVAAALVEDPTFKPVPLPVLLQTEHMRIRDMPAWQRGVAEWISVYGGVKTMDASHSRYDVRKHLAACTLRTGLKSKHVDGGFFAVLRRDPMSPPASPCASPNLLDPKPNPCPAFPSRELWERAQTDGLKTDHGTVVLQLHPGGAIAALSGSATSVARRMKGVMPSGVEVLAVQP